MPFNGSMFPVAFLKHCEILESLAEIKMGCLILNIVKYFMCIYIYISITHGFMQPSL